MRRSAAWLPLLLNELQAGLKRSLLLISLANSEELDKAGQFCLDLWPFIKDLPENIACVMESLPANMEAAKGLLSALADEEHVFRSLFVKQCLLSGLKDSDLIEPKVSEAANRLRMIMAKLCQSGDYADGMLAIVTAELAASAFARAITPFYEQYFKKHSNAFDAQQVSEGMDWLRLHAKPQTRNAFLLSRALAALKQSNGKEIPNSAMAVLESIFAVWRCETTRDLTSPVVAKQEEADLARA